MRPLSFSGIIGGNQRNNPGMSHAMSHVHFAVCTTQHFYLFFFPFSFAGMTEEERPSKCYLDSRLMHFCIRDNRT